MSTAPLTGVNLPRRWPSLLGALEGLLGAMGRLPLAPGAAISAADYLLGLSGLAFHTSLDLVVSAEGPAAYPFHQLVPLWERMRVWFRHTGAAATDPQLPALREQVREQMARSLERGWPAIAYDLGGLAEYGLVIGLAGDRLLALRPAGATAPVTLSLADLPPAAHHWSKLEVVTAVGAGEDFDRAAAEEAAVRFAVDHGWAPPSRDGWYYFGLKAYHAWRAALSLPQHAPGTAQGMAYCAEYYYQARQGAARFCHYLAGGRGWTAAAEAARAYERAAGHLATVRELLPFVPLVAPESAGEAAGAPAAGKAAEAAEAAGAPAAGDPDRAEAALRDPAVRKAATEALFQAQHAEEQALAALEQVLRGLRY